MHTADITKIIPKSELSVSLSPKNATLKTVAEIGSNTPMADAVPAGI